jgi:hypothetical protein
VQIVGRMGRTYAAGTSHCAGIKGSFNEDGDVHPCDRKQRFWPDYAAGRFDVLGL